MNDPKYYVDSVGSFRVMPTAPDQVHIEAAVSVFKILNSKTLDVDTIVATYGLDRDLVEETMERGERLGFFGEASQGSYELTSRGERLSEEIQLRGGKTVA